MFHAAEAAREEGAVADAEGADVGALEEFGDGFGEGGGAIGGEFGREGGDVGGERPGELAPLVGAVGREGGEFAFAAQLADHGGLVKDDGAGHGEVGRVCAAAT